ncbi:MAG: hypothetical protein HC933_14955, partial [Pleurocapsa sp. SU_196_0]|nr:hypothetical protein [Pleurocapsa sp. SU_196_0]
AWGANNFGQLGDGTSSMGHLPVFVQLPVGLRIRVP